MALEALYIRVTHTGQASGPLMISDIASGFDGAGSAARARRPGPVYVPVSDHVDLVYDSSVALSYESGCIKQWVTSGDLTVSLLRGSVVQKSWLYDFAELGGAIGAVTLTAPNGDALQIPAKCIGVRGWVEVVTAVTSAGAATVAVGVTGTAAALRAATGKATLAANAVLALDGSQIHNGTEAAAPVAKRYTAATSVTATVAVAALTAGKFYVHIEFISSLE